MKNRTAILIVFFTYFYGIGGLLLFNEGFKQLIINRTNDWILIVFAVAMTVLICGSGFIADKLIGFIKKRFEKSNYV